jgi:glycosyltransferase involved in cell wall biosynthesis
VRLAIAISTRFYASGDGVWTTTSYDYSYWSEHLDAFDEVVVLSRVLPIAEPTAGMKRADGAGVFFCPVPDWATRHSLPAAIRVCKQISRDSATWGAALLHTPSPEAELLFWAAQKRNLAYAVEVRGEQVLDLSYLRTRGTPLPAFVHRIATSRFARHVRSCSQAVFVSRELADRYAKFGDAPVHVISDARLPKSSFRAAKLRSALPEPIQLVNVAKFDAAKGHDALIGAFSILLRNTDPRGFHLHLVGDGPLRKEIERTVCALGLSHKVTFHGQLPNGTPVLDLMDQMDLFVLSSITEGMPRVLIEAAAMGLPAVSTRVSGAAAIVPDYALVPPKNPNGLAACIQQITSDVLILNRLASQCSARGAAFEASELRRRRTAVLHALRAEAQRRDTSSIIRSSRVRCR